MGTKNGVVQLEGSYTVESPVYTNKKSNWLLLFRNKLSCISTLSRDET
jgi:hypothetical protein